MGDEMVAFTEDDGEPTNTTPVKKEDARYDTYEDPDDEFGDIIRQLPDEETDVIRTVREFLSSEQIEGKTDLNDNQINFFTVLKTYEEAYPELGVGRLGQIFMELRRSRNGSGRGGLLDMLKGKLHLESQPETGLNENTRRGY